MEIWKQHPHLPYEISTLGRVRRNNKIMKQQLHKDGRLFIQVSDRGIKENKKIHQLVAETYLTNSENLPTIDHINRDYKDNRLCNLRYCSYTNQLVNRDYPNKLRHRNIRVNREGNYQVRIYRGGRTIYDKTFSILEEAIKARDEFLST